MLGVHVALEESSSDCASGFGADWKAYMSGMVSRGVIAPRSWVVDESVIDTLPDGFVWQSTEMEVKLA